MRLRFASACLILSAAAAVLAQPVSYARLGREIKAGTLLVDSQRRTNGFLYNPAPHAWYAMDKELGVKPSSWTFVNPLGQTTLTATTMQRWGLSSPYAVGQSMSKRDAGYWEVDLANVGDSALSQFDILLLPVGGPDTAGGLSLKASERERLRRYVDQGGILWIDLFSNAAVDIANGAPVGFEVVTGAATLEANLSSPLLNTPNSLTLDEVNGLRRGTTLVSKPVETLPGALNRILATVEPDSFRWEGVSGNGAGFAISKTTVGDGSIVVTSFGLSSTVSRGVNSGPVFNTAFRSLPIFFDALYVSGAKLVSNIVGLGVANNSPAGGSRRSGAIRGDVAAPLLQRFRVPGGSFNASTRAAHFGGYLLVTEGSTLTCFDSNPDRDIDGNGNDDDGLPDAPDANYDVVWTVDVGSDLSAPTVAEVPNSVLPSSGNPSIHQVWVVTQDGDVRGYSVETGILLATINAPSNVDTNVGPFAPAVQEGLLVVTEGVSTGYGRVRLIDLASGAALENGSNAFSLQGTTRLDVPTASPTLGYIPILDNSGGLDRVIYIATKSDTGAAGITSVWVGAKGESPVRVLKSGSTVTVATRASLQGLPVNVTSGQSPYGVRLSLISPTTGRALNPTDLTTQLTGTITASATAGEFTVTLQPGANASWDWDGNLTPSDATDDVGWRVDYTIDWSRAASNNPNADAYIRGNLILPDNSANQRVIVGSPALTSRGNLLVTHTNFEPNRTGPNINEGSSTVWNFREEGRGDFVLVNRFDLFDSVQLTFNGTSTTVYPPTLDDSDRLLAQLPVSLNAPIQDLRAISQPAIQGDTAFVVASGFKQLGPVSIPTSVLLALDANPAPVQFFVRGLSEDQVNNYSIVQPDPVRSTPGNRTTPEQVSVLPRTMFTLEETSDAGLFKVTIPNLMATPRGQIRDAISTSLPVILRRSNDGTDVLVEPERGSDSGVFHGGSAGGRYSPVQWYYVGNGLKALTGPHIAGRAMYVGGSSVVPSFLTYGISGLQENGIIYGMDTEVSSNDPFLSSSPTSPWMMQLNTVLPNSGTPWDVRANNAIRWPQPQGIRSFDDFRVRLLQNTLQEQQVSAMSVGDGALAAFSTGGTSALTVFTQADFTVVDSQRISRFDSAGNPLWVLQNSSGFGPEVQSSVASKAATLVDPSRAYPEGNDSVWLVDPGSDRIVQVDRAGQETRTVKNIHLHPNHPVAEVSAGSPLYLANPRDVAIFNRTYSAAEVAAAFPGETLEAAAGPELWRHILVADSGNKRALELVDRYRLNANGRVVDVVRYRDESGAFVPAYGVVLWHSPQELSGGRYAYNSIARLSDPTNPSNRITAFGFNSTEPGRANVGLDSPNAQNGGATGFGGVILYDESRGDTLIVNSFIKPAVPANTFLGLNAGRYYFNSGAIASEEQQISGLRSVTLKRQVIGGVRRLTVMICEATGVYELVQTNPASTDPVLRNQWSVLWMLPNEAYVAMRRPTTTNPTLGYLPGDLANNAAVFMPMHARRLDSGEVMVVNGYVGSNFNNTAAFNGEVLLVEGRTGTADVPGYNLGMANLGFNSLSVRYELPPVAGIRGLIRPIFAERK